MLSETKWVLCVHMYASNYIIRQKKLQENREKGIITFTKEKPQKIDFTKSVETQ